jgi:serine/threonine-protein kinase ULK/ATG1
MKLFLQILQGLTYLRKIKCIYRDLKPENIMIKNGNIKIADFGLSKTCEKEQLMTSLAGSPLNMAPEILKGQPYCEKVDLYSLGTILYRLLYGVEPFGGRNER